MKAKDIVDTVTIGDSIFVQGKVVSKETTNQCPISVVVNDTYVGIPRDYLVLPSEQQDNKWLVRCGRAEHLYFNNLGIASRSGTFNPSWTNRESAVVFSDFAKAKAIETLVGGDVVSK